MHCSPKLASRGLAVAGVFAAGKANHLPQNSDAHGTIFGPLSSGFDGDFCTFIGQIARRGLYPEPDHTSFARA
jgi:hypothetical protein